MKTLYIARHAKSSWEDMQVFDHDRKLLSMGEKRTQRVAGWLKKHKVRPDVIISSSAVRTFETARILAKELGFPEGKIVKNVSFYGADPEAVLKILYTLPNTVKKVMVVGHNPGFTNLVNLFLERGQQIDNLPTSGVAAVLFDTNKWEKVDLAKYRVEFLITPKMIRTPK